MPLISPKTNWVDGQEFDILVDYGRIKSNIEFIREFSLSIYKIYNINPLQVYTYEDIPLVDFFNTIVDNVNTIYDNTFKYVGFAEMKRYTGGGEGFTAAELNKIEGNLKRIYEKLQTELRGLKRLSFKLGGGDFA